MKRLIPLLPLFLLPSLAQAQETYDIAATSVQVAVIEKERVRNNVKTCLRLRLSVGCTQAQACVAAGAAGGASCTFAQALAANAELYAASLAGRDAFVEFTIFRQAVSNYVPAHQRQSANAYCTWWTSQNQTTKDAECTKAGEATPCDICP